MNDHIIADRSWVETYPIGDFKVNATFQIRNGIEIPWATRVTIEGNETFVEVKGRNILPRAIVIAEALTANRIAD